MVSMNQFANKNIIVTGHTGFKGSWLSLWLIRLGAHVTGISTDIPSIPSHFESINLKNSIRDLRLDIRDQDQISKIIKETQPDFVFHLAAQSLVRESYSNPISTWQTNTLGTINILDSLTKLTKPCVAIFITSDKCYDNVESIWGYKETDSLGGSDPYSASKGGAELAIKSYVKSYFTKGSPIRIGIGRAGNVIGGGDWATDRIIPDCVRAWSKNQSVDIRNPRATRPWQYVLEPLSGYLNLAMVLDNDNKLHGEAFNFGPPSNQNHSVGELIQEMEKHWDKVLWNDVSSEYDGPYESGLLKLNCDKALHHLGWQASWDFERTVKETVLWNKIYYQDTSNSIIDTSLSQINSYVQNAKAKGLLWAM
jgi:CDP-glucose 4,6-dehydratase